MPVGLPVHEVIVCRGIARHVGVVTDVTWMRIVTVVNAIYFVFNKLEMVPI